jgi:hypothetical protein
MKTSAGTARAWLVAITTAFALLGFASTAAAQLTGTLNIPTDYATLAAAITDLNAQGVGAGGVTLNLEAGYPETAPAGGYVIGGAGSLVLTTASAANPVTIQGNGNTITASGALTVGALNDAIFKLIGADWITVTGFTMQENPANTVILPASNTMTEWGVALLHVSTTDGAQNNTILGNTISLSRSYTNTWGVYANNRHSATAITVTEDVINNTTGPNSGNKVYGNTISNVNMGVAFIGTSAAANQDFGNDVGGTSTGTGNIISNWGGAAAASGYVSNSLSSYCIYMNHQTADNVSYNTITSAAVSGTSVAFRGIFKEYLVSAPTGTFTTNITNNTVTMTSGFTTGVFEAIRSQGMTALPAATININGNTILNCAVTGALSSSAIVGVVNSSVPGTLSLSNNVVRGTTSTATTGGFTGVQNAGAVVNTINLNNNQIGNASGGAITFSAATSGAVYGVYNTSGASTAAISIGGNDIRGITHSVAGTSAHNYIYNSAGALSQNISNNTFTNLNVNTTGTVYFVYDSATAPVGGSKTINGNSIVTAYNKAGAGGTVYPYYDFASSGAGIVVNNNNNNFSNITVTGATTLGGWYNNDGGAPTKTIQNNTFSNWTGGTSAITVMNLSYAASATVTQNTISNITGGGAVTGMVLGSALATVNASQNTISGLSSTGVATVSGLTSASTTANLLKNKIYDLSGSNALTTMVNGLVVSAGTTVTAANNLIGDLRAPAASATGDVVRGINLTSGTTLSSINLYYNTIYLNATSTGANFSSSGVYHTTNTTATTAALNMRNNVVVNLSTPNGTGLTAAYRRSSIYLNNYAATSNTNLLYAGTPGANRLIFNDGTNSDQTLGAFQTRVSPREASSVTENPAFLSTTGSSPSFLHINPAIATQIESGGQAVAGITDDYDGDLRNASTPDIGGDEGTFLLGDSTGPAIAYTPLANTGLTGDRTLTATITDASGVPTSGIGLPVLYWRINAGAYAVATATSLGGNQYQFAFGAGVVGADVVSYYIVAQDNAGTPNVSVSPSGGAAGLTANPPAAGTPPTAPNSYTIVPSIAGTFTVGSGGNYATLTAAVADLNAKFVSGAVTFLLTDASYGGSETFPITVNANAGMSAINTLTISPAGGQAPTISGSVASNALIKLNGADYVTIDGSNSGGSDRSLTITNSGTTAPCAVWISSLGNGAGATNATVKNCNISTSAATTATAYGIAVSGATIGSAGGDNDNVTLQNNAINSSNIGVYANGNAAASAGGMDNLVVNGNAFISTGTLAPTYGVEVANALNAAVSQNTFNLTTTASTQPVGLSIEANVSNSSVTANRITAVVTTATGGYGGRGITVGTGTTSSNITVANNFVAGVNGSNYSSFSASSAMGIGIGVVGNGSLTATTGGVKLYHNSVNMYGSYSYSAACLTAGLYVGTGASALDIRNNIIVNSLNNTNSSGTASKNYAVYSAVANSAYAPISYNDYYVSGLQGVLGFLGSDQATLSAFNTAFTGNPSTPALNVVPAFTSPTDLHIPAAVTTMLESGGTSGTGVAVDIEGETRPGPDGSVNGGATAPDVGADEFDGTPLVANDLAATAFVDPTNGGTKAFEVAFAPQASFTNLGTVTQTGVTVRYRIVGPSPSMDEIYNQTASIASIVGMATTTVTFPSVTPAAAGTYTIYSAAELPGDQVPGNDQIAGTMSVLGPLSGTYLVGTTLFNELTGADLTFEPQVHQVMRELLEIDAQAQQMGGDKPSGEIVWKTVVREVDEVTWVPMSNGQQFEGPLYVKRAGNPNLPVDARDGVYATLTAAVADLNARGLSGPVQFLLTDPNYPTETFPITVNANAGLSAINNLTISPAGGQTPTISGSILGGSLIKLNGADYVTIDGSNNGGSDRSLTITNSSTTAPCAIWISSLGNGAGATNNTVKNCNINTSAATSATAYGIAVSGATIGSAGGDNDNITLRNNAINSSNIGIYANGNAAVSAGGMDNLVVAGNAFTGASALSPMYGVEVANALNASVRENTFNLTTSASTQPVGLSIEANVSNSTVIANRINAVVTTSTAGYGGRGITVGTGTTGSNITVANNFVAGVNGSNYNSFGNSSAMGIAIGVIGNSGTLTTTTGGVNLYHNSVNMAGSYSYAAACLTAGLYVGSGASALDIRNNIIVNSLNNTNASGTASKNYAVYSAVANTAYAPISYNDYYVSGLQGVLGFLGTDQTTLSAFNTAFTGNPSTPALNVVPAFTSPTDLHIPAAVTTLLESGGTSGTGVTVDIEGETRPGPDGSVNGGATAPDVGADEFDGTPVVANDFAATAFVDPTNGGTKSVGVAFAPQASFTNLGLATQTNVTVRYRIVGPSPSGTEVYNQTATIASLAGMAITTVTFPSATLTTGGSYTIYAASELVGDGTPGNDQITGSMAVLTPLSGTYLVGVSAYKEAGGGDVTFERQVQRVTREVLEPVEPLGGDKSLAPEQMEWKLVTREVEEETWVPLVNGQKFEQPLRVSREEDSGLPAWSRDGAYATITAAVADLNVRGVDGPVQFLLTDATYPTETFPITVNVTSAAPTPTNTVTFKPNAGVTTTVSGASASSAIFKVFNTSYVTIDGSNTESGTTRNLTLENTSITSPNVVWFGSSGTTPITHETLKNCVVRNGVNTSSAVVISDGTIAGNAGYFSNLEVRNNKIEKAYIGVYANGGTTPQNGAGLTLAGNELNTAGTNAIRHFGLYVQGVNGGTIANNDLGNLEVATSENDFGIWLATGATNFTVNANRIHDIGYTGTSGYGGKGIAVSTGVAAAAITVANNMIFNITGDGDSYTSFGCTYSPVGIYAYGTQGGLDIYDNSIFMYGNTINYSASAYSAGIALDDASAANVSGNNVVNNLGRLTTVGVGAAAIALETGASQLATGDYNNLYTDSTGGGTNLVGKIGATDYATMAAWRTASGRDASSVAANPEYVSNTDLHVRTDVLSPVSNVGVSIATVTNDYDGDLRTATPDIGADEFTVFTLATAVVGSGTVTVSPAQTAYAAGTVVTLTAIPTDACQEFAGWTGDATGNVNPLVVVMDANKTITATFVFRTSTIIASAGAGGTISPSGEVSVGCGSDATFTITPTSCFQIADVLVDGTSVGAVGSYTFSGITANHTIAASFVQTTYTIAAAAAAGGSITPAGAVSVNCGADQTFTITPASCFEIADVLVDGVSVGAVASYTFNGVSANHTIDATFVQTTYTIAASAGPNGAIDPNGAVTVTCGADQTFTVTPAANFYVADVLVDGVSVGAVASYTFEDVAANHTIAATFDAAAYTITATAGTGGAIDPSGAVAVDGGADVTFTITPASCYQIADVLVDGVSVGAVATYTFNDVASDHTIEASFVQTTYTIAASAGAGGAISPNGAVPAVCGTDVTFTITPEGCYGIADVLVDGVSVGAVATYTFNGVAANHTITASFVQGVYTITATAGPGGAIAPSGAVVVPCGGDQVFGIAPQAGYAILDVLVDGVSVGAVETYTFTDVQAAHTIAASFRDSQVPVVAVVAPNGGEQLYVGLPVDLVWNASDNVGVTAVDLLLSRAGAGGAFETLATDLPNSGTYSWTVTGPGAMDGILKVVAHDGAGNTGEDVSDAVFGISDLTAVPMTDFRLEPIVEGVAVRWSLDASVDFASMAVERSDSPDDGWQALGQPALDDHGNFVLLDTAAELGRTYWYRLTVSTSSGQQFVLEAASVMAGLPVLDFALPAVGPNPLRWPALVSFAVPRQAHVSVCVYDIRGRRVATLADDNFAPGRYQINWNGDADMAKLVAGVYFVRLETPGTVLTQRVLYVH